MSEPEKVIFHEYFCTVGSGLEKFCGKELLDLGSTILDITLGKVFFSSSLPVRKLLSLKTVERLFLLVHKESQFLLNHPKRESIYMLRALVEENRTHANWDVNLKKWREFQSFDEAECPNGGRIRFRVSCKCSGKIKYVFPPVFLGKLFAGSLLNTHTKWTTDLRNPQLEVLVHAAMDTLTIGLACGPMNKPLSKRWYLQKICNHAILRPTVCYAMLTTALPNYKANSFRSESIPCEVGNEFCNSEQSLNIKRHPLVLLDPMCGTGIILAEAAAWLDLEDDLILFGSDSDISQLHEAASNIISAENKHSESTSSDANHEIKSRKKCNSNLFMADARALPLKDSSVDCIVSDIPFGLKHLGKPWTKDLLVSERKVKTVLETNEICLVKDEIKSTDPYVREGSDMTCNKITNIQEGKNLEIASVVLDTANNTGNKDGEMAKIECCSDKPSELTVTDEGSKRKKLFTGSSSKRRKVKHKSEPTDSTSIKDVRNMLPLVVAEMDRVLIEGGRAVLLISETLRSSLLETVNTVTNSKCTLKYPTKDTNLSQLIKTHCRPSITVSSTPSDIIDIPNNTIHKGETCLSQNGHSWVCSEQHKVKLGILDAVICVFNK